MMRDLFIGLGTVVVSVFILLAIFSPTEQPEITTMTDKQIIQPPQSFTSNTVTINVPAVDNQGNGVVAK